MKLDLQFLAQNSGKMMRAGGYYSLFISYSWKLLKLPEILKEKLKQNIQWNNENFVGILQIHEVEITI